MEHRRQPDLFAELPVTVQSNERAAGAVHLQVQFLIAFSLTWGPHSNNRAHTWGSIMLTTIRSLSLRSFWFTAVAMLTFVAAYLTPGSAQQAARVSPDVYSRLRWRFIGPEGNRTSAVVGVPGDPLVYYAG